MSELIKEEPSYPARLKILSGYPDFKKYESQLMYLDYRMLIVLKCFLDSGADMKYCTVINDVLKPKLSESGLPADELAELAIYIIKSFTEYNLELDGIQ